MSYKDRRAAQPLLHLLLPAVLRIRCTTKSRKIQEPESFSDANLPIRFDNVVDLPTFVVHCHLLRLISVARFLSPRKVIILLGFFFSFIEVKVTNKGSSPFLIAQISQKPCLKNFTSFLKDFQRQITKNLSEYSI